MVGILAILKAGGAYLPLDPGYPRERLLDMVRDSAPVALVTRAELAGRLPPGHSGNTTISPARARSSAGSGTRARGSTGSCAGST